MYFVVAIAPDYRSTLNHTIILEVFSGYQAGIFLHGTNNQLSHRTFVKSIAALSGNHTQGFCQIGLTPQRARRQGFALGVKIIFFRRGRRRQSGSRPLQGKCQRNGDGKTLLCQPNGRHQHRLQWQRTIAIQRVNQSGHGAGNTCRLVAITGFFRVGFSIRAEEHINRGCQRRRFAVIDGNRALLIRKVHQHKTTTTQITRLRQCNGEREPCGYRRIDGIAARAQYLRTDFAGQSLLGNDHTSATDDRVKTISKTNEWRIAAVLCAPRANRHQGREANHDRGKKALFHCVNHHGV